MITNNYSLTINGYECKLNKPLKFYQGDSLHLIFTVNQYEWVINNGNRVRAIMPINPLKAFLIIENPEDEATDTIESAFVENDEIHFHIDSKYTSFVGVGRMQLVLADDGCCSVTIPEFTYEIKKNITDKLLNLSKTTLIDTDNKVLMTDSGYDMITGLALSTESNTSKYIKDLPNKELLDGQESVLIQDREGTKNVNMKVLLDDINSRTNLTEIQNQIIETNTQLSEIKLLTTLQELINQSNLKSIDLSVGSKVTTTGYYEPNDKGEATYVVSDDSNLVADSLFVFNLSNGKKLVRQYNDEVSAESIGFRESYRYNQIFDNTPILIKLVEYLNQSERQISLKFGHGWYGFSEGAELYLNHKNGVKITGESGIGEMFMGKQDNGYSRGGFGTIFFGINENQEYILKFNGERTVDHKTLRHVNLSNIIFWCGTCSIINSTFKIQRYGNGCKTPLKLHQVTFSKFKDLIFTGGHAVTDGIYWTGYECFFEDIMFRDMGKFGVLNSCINTYSTSEPYTIPSGSMFNKLSFENIAGSLLDLGQMTDVQFTNLSLEITNIEGCERTNFVTGSSYTDIPLIKFSDTHGAITFDNITVQHMSRFMYTQGSQSYAFRTIFYNSNDYGFGDGLVVSNISLQGTPQNVWLLKYKSSNVNASTNPIYNFNGVQLKTLSQGDSANILIDVPSGVIVNRDGLSTNSVKSNKKHTTIFNKELTWKDTNLMSRITFDKDLQEHCLKPLSANYNSSIHGTPSVIFKADTNLMIGTTKTVTGSLIMKKYPTATSVIEVKLIVGYNDGSSVIQTFNVDNQNARIYSVNLELKPGIITHVRVEQTTEYNEETLDFTYFYSMFMGLL